MKSARIASFLAVVLVTAQVGIAADEAPKKQQLVLQSVADSPLAPMSLSAIFAAASADHAAEQAAAPRGVLVGVPNVEVLVARIENGKVVTACVSSEKAARKFLQQYDMAEPPVKGQ
jgi:hypothetical protein